MTESNLTSTSCSTSTIVSSSNDVKECSTGSGSTDTAGNDEIKTQQVNWIVSHELCYEFGNNNGNTGNNNNSQSNQKSSSSSSSSSSIEGNGASSSIDKTNIESDNEQQQKQFQQQQQSSSSSCFYCGKKQQGDDGTTALLLKCSKCKVATYCSKECQINDWKIKKNTTGVSTTSTSTTTSSQQVTKGTNDNTVLTTTTTTNNGRGHHKESCYSYSRLNFTRSNNDNGMILIQLKSEQDKITVKNELLYRLRYYIQPYAIYQSCQLGPGMLLIQSNHTLAIMSLLYPPPLTTCILQSSSSSSLSRSVLIHYLTFAEYDMEVCRDDFEMAIVRNEVKDAIDTCYSTTSTTTTTNEMSIIQNIVVLMRFRCGHVSVGIVPLSIEYNTCLKLGQDYFANNNTTTTSSALQLNIDDT